ncbi:hypothetical protein [Actinacidiphila sp. bgisy167]|uniref:hypothetical protein n=1 Tax=Actinacidiphila sp. bgisy167 TaxID=3413797 RepID=UPI003D74300C
MAYAVLYIAFGVVALWLLGEVLLQYKARLRWRLLAFAGFLGVVLGVTLPSILVIAAGAIAFGVGQTFVTLSYRRGFVEGWALKAPKGHGDGEDDDDDAAPQPRRGAGRRGRDAQHEEAPADGVAPPYEEPGVEAPAGAGAGQPYDAQAAHTAAGPAAAAPAGMDSTQVYQPMPMHEDSGEYPMYGGQPNQAQPSYAQDPYAGAGAGYQGYEATTGYGDWNGGQQQQQPAAASYEAYGQQQTGGWEQQAAYGGYQDPYQGQNQGQNQGQGAPQQQYGYDTPAGGVWVPQQGGEQQPYIPQQGSYDQQGQGQGQYDPYDPYRYN